MLAVIYPLGNQSRGRSINLSEIANTYGFTFSLVPTEKEMENLPKRKMCFRIIGNMMTFQNSRNIRIRIYDNYFHNWFSSKAPQKSTHVFLDSRNLEVGFFSLKPRNFIVKFISLILGSNQDFVIITGIKEFDEKWILTGTPWVEGFFTKEIIEALLKFPGIFLEGEGQSIYFYYSGSPLGPNIQDVAKLAELALELAEKIPLY